MKLILTEGKTLIVSIVAFSVAASYLPIMCMCADFHPPSNYISVSQ